MQRNKDGVLRAQSETKWNRRDFIKKTGLLLLLAAAGCRDMQSEGNDQPKIVLATGKYSNAIDIMAVTDTANWVVRDGMRVNLFDYPFVAGVTNYMKWSEFESFEGEYNWNSLSRMLREADDANKKLSINILAGIHAPYWLYKSAPAVELLPCGGGRPRRCYLPWADINGERVLNTRFLETWESTISKYANFLNSHPLRDRLAYTAITGGPASNGLEVMWPGYSGAPFVWDDRTAGIFVSFWKRLIDIFTRQFRSTTLGLAVTDLFVLDGACANERRIDIATELVDYAIARGADTGNRVVPMGLWFGNIPYASLKTHPLMKLLGSYEPFAVQGDVYTKDLDSLKGMFETAKELNPAWVELWHNDILNPHFLETLMEMGTKMESTSWS